MPALDARLILIAESDGMVSVTSPALPGFCMKVGREAMVGAIIDAAAAIEAMPRPEIRPEWEKHGIPKSTYYARKGRGKMILPPGIAR